MFKKRTRYGGVVRSACAVFTSFALVVSLNPASAFAAGEADVASSGIISASQDLTQLDAAANAGDLGERNFGYHPETKAVKSVHDANEVQDSVELQAALPSKYDSRSKGYITPIRDQASFGTCWAFASIQAAEASILAHGQASNAKSLDLSERHLAYFTYHNASDPLGNTAGDETTSINYDYSSSFSDPYLDMGGNNGIASNILTSWQGTASEGTASYQELLSALNKYGKTDTFLSKTALPESIAYAKDKYHVEQVSRIAMSDRDSVKRAIMKNGAVATSVYWNPYYVNESNATLYNYGTASFNHAITLVGWDDSYSRTNFGYSDWYRPSNDGAWLLRNSWGTGAGKKGYYWVSYEDYALNSYFAQAYAYKMGKSDNYDNVYQYDGTAYDGSSSVNSGGSIANVFTATGNKAKGAGEKLQAVGFQLQDVNVDYKVQIYLNPKSGNPTSGRPVLASPVTGHTKYEGYYTVKLPNPVVIPEGTKYAVVVTLSHSDGSIVSFGIDTSDNWGWARFDSSAKAGQSFRRYLPGDSWDDMGSDGSTNVRLKAYSSNVSASVVQSTVAGKKKGYSFKSKTVSYNGKKQTLKYSGKLPAGVSVSYSNNGKKAIGKYKVKATFRYGSVVLAKKSAYLTVKQGKQKLVVPKRQLSKSVSYWDTRWSSCQTSKVRIKGAKTKLAYKKVSGSRCLFIGKTSGKIVVRKGVSQGNYKIKVKATAVGNKKTYARASKTFTVTVHVR